MPTPQRMCSEKSAMCPHQPWVCAEAPPPSAPQPYLMWQGTKQHFSGHVYGGEQGLTLSPKPPTPCAAGISVFTARSGNAPPPAISHC